MKSIKQFRFAITLFAILCVSRWLHAQKILKNNDEPIQKSLQGLLAPAPTPSSFGRPSNLSPMSTHEKFATFLADGNFKSVLLLENFRPDLPITFIPSLILGNGEVPLDPVTVPAHNTATIDINALMQARGFTDTRGAVSVRFDFTTYGPGSAVVQMSDERHHLYLNSYAQSSEEYWSGTSYDAVVWAPTDGTKGFISVTNSSKEVHLVHAKFSVNGKAEDSLEIRILPRQTRILQIDDLLKRSKKSGGGEFI